MVKKLIVFLFVAGMGIGSLSAQLAKTCFTNMPDSLSPLLTAVNRADFITCQQTDTYRVRNNSFWFLCLHSDDGQAEEKKNK